MYVCNYMHRPSAILLKDTVSGRSVSLFFWFHTFLFHFRCIFCLYSLIHSHDYHTTVMWINVVGLYLLQTGLLWLIHKDKQTSGLRIQKKIINSRYGNATSSFCRVFNSVLAFDTCYSPVWGAPYAGKKLCLRFWVRPQSRRLRAVFKTERTFLTCTLNVYSSEGESKF